MTTRRRASHAAKRPTLRQKEKSRISQHVILDATAECLADQGYSRLTITAVAERAGLSRGAMQYHFRSKEKLISATLQHILHKQLALVDIYVRHSGESLTRPLHRRRVESLWRFLKQKYYVAFVEIAMAARIDAKLKRLLAREYKKYRKENWRIALDDLPEWRTDLPRFEFVAHFVATVLEGMALRQMFGQSTEGEDQALRRGLSDRLTYSCTL